MLASTSAGFDGTVAGLSALQLPPVIAGRLGRAGFRTTLDVLHCSPSEIESRSGLSAERARLACGAAYQFHVCPAELGRTALQMLGQSTSMSTPSRLTTGCARLDACLGGGLLARGITEVAGESATGKTQWGLQLSLTAQLPVAAGGLGGGTAYLCTESVMPIRRLNQLAEHFRARFPGAHERSVASLTGCVYVQHVRDTEDQWDVVSRRLPLLLAQRNVRLVVLDSVAALFRVEFSVEQAGERANELFRLGARLKAISDQFGVCVVCINQVSDYFGKDDKTGSRGGSDSAASSGRLVVPYGGLAWSNVINTRVLLTRTRHGFLAGGTGDGGGGDCSSRPSDAPRRAGGGDDGSSASGSVDQRAVVAGGGGGHAAPADNAGRRMHVVLSPHAPNSRCDFVVTEQGVFGQ